MGMARRTLEPVLQPLSREHLLDSTRGPHSFYRLGRPGPLIKVADVITAGLKSLEDGGLDRQSPATQYHATAHRD